MLFILNYMFLLKFKFIALFFIGCIFLFSENLHPIEDFDWREYYALGNEHFKDERYENALDYYKRAERMIKAGRNFFQVKKKELKYITPAHIFTAIGNCYVYLKQPYKARDYYRLSLELNENQPKLLLYLARFYQKRRNYEKSKKYFDQYYNFGGTQSSTFLQYAYVLAALGNKKEAIKFLKLKSKKSEAIYNECIEYDKQNKIIKAKNCFIKLVYLNPSQPLYYEYLSKYGIFYQDKMKKIYSFVLEDLDILNKEKLLSVVDTWYIERQNRVTYLWRNPKEILDPYEFSVYWAKKLYIIFGDEVKYCWPYFYLLYEKRKYRKALRVIHHILKVSPKNFMGKIMLAEIQREKNKVDLSNEIFNQAIKNKK